VDKYDNIEKVTGENQMTLAWYDPTNKHVSTDKNDPLFTPLGQLWPLEVRREWVGLTDDEIEHLRNGQPLWAVRDIEAKFPEKNGG